MLKKLSEKIGFTQTEIKVITFLIVVFLTGFGYKTIKHISDRNVNSSFNYISEDSLFEKSGKDTIIDKENREINDKKVDYKQEVLDFNTTNFGNKSKKVLPSEKSINLNKAGQKELILLPGIGEKTAAKIIKLREKLGGFKKLKDLIKVKGIGNSKFNKIKKYLYIE